MNTPSEFLFRSKRLGFRNWKAEDVKAMSKINADPEVMKYFPATLSAEETAGFIERSMRMFEERKYCYFACELLESSTFIGFIGLSYQTYESEFTPCTDIGWRLNKAYWNKGYATEGAIRCLQYGLESLELDTIVATATKINTPSIRVMHKAGLKKLMDFKHPRLLEFEHLHNCVCYSTSV